MNYYAELHDRYLFFLRSYYHIALKKKGNSEVCLI